MATVVKCDRCGKIVTGDDREFKDPSGFKVNSVRLGFWDQRKKEWKNIASGYDLCSDCASKIYDAVCGEGSEIEMREKINPKKVAAKPAEKAVDPNKAPEENQATDLEAEQHSFDQQLKEEDGNAE